MTWIVSGTARERSRSRCRPLRLGKRIRRIVDMKKTLFLIVGLLAVLSYSAAIIGTPADAQVAQAAMRGDREAVKGLLQKGADVNIALSDGMTAMHYAAAVGDAQM